MTEFHLWHHFECEGGCEGGCGDGGLFALPWDKSVSGHPRENFIDSDCEVPLEADTKIIVGDVESDGTPCCSGLVDTVLYAFETPENPLTENDVPKEVEFGWSSKTTYRLTTVGEFVQIQE